MPHFLTKIPVSRQIRLVFWGRNWQFFPISRLLLPDPETTSLVDVVPSVNAVAAKTHLANMLEYPRKLARLHAHLRSEYNSDRMGLDILSSNWTQKIDLNHTLGTSRFKAARRSFTYFTLKAAVREVVSGSGRSAQKSEKLAYFSPISEPQFDEKIGILFKKCGIFLIRRLQFL